MRKKRARQNKRGQIYRAHYKPGISYPGAAKTTDNTESSKNIFSQ